MLVYLLKRAGKLSEMINDCVTNFLDFFLVEKRVELGVVELWRQRQVDLLELELQPGLHGRVHDSQGYGVRPCFLFFLKMDLAFSCASWEDSRTLKTLRSICLLKGKFKTISLEAYV